jgi:cytochrome c-type biogenesis protein CcmH/NrfF
MFQFRKLKTWALVAFAAAFCVAQSASEYETPEVNAIAGKLNCNCGCKLKMNCVMPPTGVCPECRKEKIRMAQMLKEGKTEQQILDTYVQERGPDVLAIPPGTLGYTAPYIALGLGLVGLIFVIRYLQNSKAAPPVAPANDAELARYHDQIEKDLEKLD